MTETKEKFKKFQKIVEDFASEFIQDYADSNGYTYKEAEEEIKGNANAFESDIDDFANIADSDQDIECLRAALVEGIVEYLNH